LSTRDTVVDETPTTLAISLSVTTTAPNVLDGPGSDPPDRGSGWSVVSVGDATRRWFLARL